MSQADWIGYEEALTRVLATYPDIKASIVDGPYAELLHELRHGLLDVIVGALRFPPPTDDITQRLLFDDPLSIVVRPGHPVLAGTMPGAAALAALDWIVPREGTPARAEFVAFFDAHGVIPPRRIVECSSLVTTRGLLLRSDRAALLSALQVRHEIETGTLAALPAPLPGTERAIGLTVRADWKPTVAQQHFLEVIEQTARAQTAAHPP